MNRFVEKIWKDPVWSKVIAGIILALISFLCTVAYSLYTENSLIDSLIEIGSVSIEIWAIILTIFAYLCVSSVVNIFKDKKFTYDTESLDLDRKLFKKITKELIKQDHEIYFLRTNNFAGFSFNPDLLSGLHHYHGLSNNSDFEFINPYLQEINHKLAYKVDRFLECIANNTFLSGTNRQTVPPEWEMDQPEHFRETVKKLHEQKYEICKTYDDLVRNGRKVLKV